VALMIIAFVTLTWQILKAIKKDLMNRSQVVYYAMQKAGFSINLR